MSARWKRAARCALAGWALAVACPPAGARTPPPADDVPPAPPTSTFPALMVAPEGTAIASLRRAEGCGELVAWDGARRHAVSLVARKGDIAMLHVRDNRWPAMPRRPTLEDIPSEGTPATVLSLDGLAPAATAAQVRGGGLRADTLRRARPGSGVVLDEDGAVLGFATELAREDDRIATLRVAPLKAIRDALAEYDLRWADPEAAAPATPEQALREAIASTLPIACVAAARTR